MDGKEEKEGVHKGTPAAYIDGYRSRESTKRKETKWSPWIWFNAFTTVMNVLLSAFRNEGHYFFYCFAYRNSSEGIGHGIAASRVFDGIHRLYTQKKIRMGSSRISGRIRLFLTSSENGIMVCLDTGQEGIRK